MEAAARFGEVQNYARIDINYLFGKQYDSTVVHEKKVLLEDLTQELTELFAKAKRASVDDDLNSLFDTRYHKINQLRRVQSELQTKYTAQQLVEASEQAAYKALTLYLFNLD
jgi:hypothetical protein